MANAARYGAHFVVTGCQHFTLDDVFCASEIPVGKEQIKKIKKNKKERSTGIALTGEANKVLVTWKPISGMVDQELNVLLKWFNVPNSTLGRMDERRNCLKNNGW